MNKSVLANFSSVEYGTVLLPKEILGSAELKLNGVYTYNNTQYNAATVKAVKLYRDTDTSVQFTAALTGIQEKSYATVYAARGYITYTDLNGVVRTVYSTDTDATSLYEVAQKLVALDPNDAAANAIIEAVEG